MTPIKALTAAFKKFSQDAEKATAEFEEFSLSVANGLSVVEDDAVFSAAPDDFSTWNGVSVLVSSDPTLTSSIAAHPPPSRLTKDQEALLAAAAKIVEDARAVDEEAARRAAHSGRRAMRLTGELP